MWIWLVIAGTLAIVYLSMRPADCTIRFRNGRVTVKGRITHHHRLAVEEFLNGHFSDVARMRIDLHYPRGGSRLRVRIRGALAKGERQMIRNFILAEF